MCLAGVFHFRRTQIMSTQAQIQANHQNAQHSTGPKTEEGRAASSQNNFRHGFAAKFKVLDWEEQSEFAALLTNFTTEHQPQSPYEETLVEKMAQHFWLAQRALTLQNECFNPKLAMQEADRKLALFMRYQTTQDRAFHKCADELRKLRNEKRKQQIGFESQNQKEAEEARRHANEIRKGEMHEARLRLVNSKVDHTEIDNDIRQTIEAPLPGHMRVPFNTLKTVFATAVEQVNRNLKTAQAA